MNREVNNGYKYNPQKDLLPLFGEASAKGKFQKILAEAAGVKEEEILGHDLFCITVRRELSGAHKKSLFPSEDWMISSAPLLL